MILHNPAGKPFVTTGVLGNQFLHTREDKILMQFSTSNSSRMIMISDFAVFLNLSVCLNVQISWSADQILDEMDPNL